MGREGGRREWGEEGKRERERREEGGRGGEEERAEEEERKNGIKLPKLAKCLHTEKGGCCSTIIYSLATSSSSSSCPTFPSPRFKGHSPVSSVADEFDNLKVIFVELFLPLSLPQPCLLQVLSPPLLLFPLLCRLTHRTHTYVWSQWGVVPTLLTTFKSHQGQCAFIYIHVDK